MSIRQARGASQASQYDPVATLTDAGDGLVQNARIALRMPPVSRGSAEELRELLGRAYEEIDRIVFDLAHGPTKERGEFHELG